MFKRVAWKIWYDDGSTFSNEEGSWDAAPPDGILIVMETFDDGKKLVHMGSDYYLMLEDGTIVDCGVAHIERHLRKLLPQLKYGRWSGNELWERVHNQAFGIEP